MAKLPTFRHDEAWLRMNAAVKWGARTIFPMDVSELDFSPSSSMLKAAKEEWDRVPLGYGVAHGSRALAQSLSEIRSVLLSNPVNPERIRITPGVRLTIRIIVAEMALNFDKAVMLTPPVYDVFCNSVRLARKPYGIVDIERFTLHPAAYLKKGVTYLLMLNNPVNPTGKIVKPSALWALREIAEAYNCFVLFDEIYDLVF